jgi:hypothetical protein
MTPMNDADRLALMAYVDGEMSARDAADFERRMATDLDLAVAVRRERALREHLRAAYSPVLDEPMPIGLLDLLSMPGDADLDAPTAANDSVLAGMHAGAHEGERAPARAAWRRHWPQWGAMAASLVLGVVVGARFLAPGPAGGGDALALAASASGVVTAQGPLRDALEHHIGGMSDTAGTAVAVGLSFRDHEHLYCRTFALEGASAGIACKQGERWVVAHLEQPAVGPAASAPGTYRVAASPFSPGLLQAVDALRGGDTLDSSGEAAARARGWKP